LPEYIRRATSARLPDRARLGPLEPAQAIVAQHLASFQQFPPRQRPGSFSVEQAMEKLRNPPSSN
jgi:hypothetical protein